ncbi:hypothetical protein EDD11_007828 [Mortierella claussenii]|nr:hypothetical protein EDD11_007828 [Mortierella claussenii]
MYQCSGRLCLILGAIVSKSRSVVDDVSDARIKTVYTTVVVQGVYRLEPNLPKFYGRSGEILEHVLEQYSIPSNLSILGYLKYRRTETHQLSLRDKTVALNLKVYLERKRALSTSPSNPFAPRLHEAFPVTMTLFTAKTNENMSTHDYDYTFWSIGDDESSFEAMPVEVSNMIESPQEDYQSFQSNLATGVSRHTASIGMMHTIRNVPTTVLVDGHEAMYRDSFEATKSLTKSVLESEQAVQGALKEIEKLRDQLENAKVSASIRKREQLANDEKRGANQENLQTRARSPQPQHSHSQSRLQTQAVTRSPATASAQSTGGAFSYTSGTVSPPDLLY